VTADLPAEPARRPASRGAVAAALTAAAVVLAVVLAGVAALAVMAGPTWTHDGVDERRYGLPVDQQRGVAVGLPGAGQAVPEC
jgi:hypothetical protein